MAWLQGADSKALAKRVERVGRFAFLWSAWLEQPNARAALVEQAEEEGYLQ